ncbi:MAG: VOC family protein [Gammaproteobacteria bacterium]
MSFHAPLMKPRISVVTLGVSDMDRAVRFYRDGLELPMRDDKPPVIYFELQGTWLALYPRERLASFAGIDPTGRQPGDGESRDRGFGGMTLSVNVDARAAVDAVMHGAERAGANVTRTPHEFSWGGYAGWFQDPDGHAWEIVYNPRPFM